METRANHVLIGLFTLLGMIGGMLLFLWFAKAEADRSYAYYDVRFESVSGLREAGDVRYNGLPVGQVVGLFLDPENPASVRVRLALCLGVRLERRGGRAVAAAGVPADQ